MFLYRYVVFDCCKILSLQLEVSCNSERAHVLVCHLYIHEKCEFIKIILRAGSCRKNTIIGFLKQRYLVTMQHTIMNYRA